MKKTIILTIIVPVYNTEKYLIKCIKSILNNRSNEFEVVLINDGSTDNSGKICEIFLEKYPNKIRYINKKNEGCSTARNLGIDEAQGEYIWFVDSDDYLEKNAVDEIITILKKEKLDLINFGNNEVLRNDIIIEKNLPSEVKNKKEILFQKNSFANIWNKIYRKEIILENNIRFPINTHLGEDLAFNFKYLYFIKNFLIYRKELYNYLIGVGVTANIRKRKEIFLAFDDIFNFYIEKKEFESMREILKKYYEKHAIFYPYNLILSSDISKIQKRDGIKELNFELNKRKYIFKTRFLKEQLYYYLKYKLDFLRPYYRKIKRLINTN